MIPKGPDFGWLAILSPSHFNISLQSSSNSTDVWTDLPRKTVTARGRKPSRRKRKGRRSLGWGVLLLVVGLFSLVCQISALGAVEGAVSSFVGALGQDWGRAQLGLFGYPALALPLVAAYAGLALLRGTTERLLRQLLGFLLLIASLAVFFALATPEDAAPVTFGGWFGAWAHGGLHAALGGLGTVLIAVLALLFGFTLATGVRFSEILDFLGRGGKSVGRAVGRGAKAVGRAVREVAASEEAPANPPADPSQTESPSTPAPSDEPVAKPVRRGLEPVHGAPLEPPPLGLLGPTEPIDSTTDDRDAAWAETLRAFLEQHTVAANIVGYERGPALGVFELRLAPRERLNKLEKLTPELALALQAPAVRIVPRPERGSVDVEVPLAERDTVPLRRLLEEPAWQTHPAPLAFPVGLRLDGTAELADLAQLPHLLIAGTTGSGKSVFLNALLLSLLCRVGPQTLRLLLIDPGRVELTPYAGLPHLIVPPVIDPLAALGELEALVQEMDQRYQLLARARKRSLESYNAAAEAEDRDPLPWVVVAVDELAELMVATGRGVEQPLSRLAQMARAVGIHLVAATQRPSVDVVTGVLKANFPSRAAFKVRSAVDSRVILDQGGAEKLLGRGDMLFLPVGAAEPLRLQGAYVDETAVSAVVRHWRGTPPPSAS